MIFVKIIWIVFVSTLPMQLSAASLKLLNASLEDTTAYFASLTGNTYALSFQSNSRFSVIRDDLETLDEFHQLFVEIISSEGAEVQEKSPGNFVIVAADGDASEATPQEVATRHISRVTLGSKISFIGLRNLLGSFEAYANVDVIEENGESKSVILLGPRGALDDLAIMLAALPPTVILEEAQAALQSGFDIQAVSANLTITHVVDLSFADASEVVENLKESLGGGIETDALRISAHRSANQVIISGPENKVYETLEVISKLDRAPRQVYVDAIIAEVSEETAAKLGLQFAINSNNLAASVVTGVSGVNIGSSVGDPFLAGAAGGLLAIGGGASAVPDIGLIVSAIQGDKDNRILATPSLMTHENKESVILVGQNVPFITGQYTNSNGDNSAPFQTIKREDLGTSLKLKPKIGPNGNIVMEIWQEVSRIDQSIPGLSDVVTVKRQISTVISAQDGETIAIGGLKNEQQELGISKVPFLGDLPVIGSIFRQEVSNSVSRNLAIFLRPTLVNNPEQREKILKIWKKKLAPGLSDVATDKTRFFENKSIADRMPETPLTKKDQAPLQ